MMTILFPTVSSKLTNTVSLLKLVQPGKHISRVKKLSVTGLRQKIAMAALLIRDRRFPQATSRTEQAAWQQAYDCLLVALQMLKQAERTPRHAIYCTNQARSLFTEANEIAAVYQLATPLPQSQEWIG